MMREYASPEALTLSLAYQKPAEVKADQQPVSNVIWRLSVLSA